jgi:Protein of unknown function (DUF1631)
MKNIQMWRIGVSDDPGNDRPTLNDCLELVLEKSPELMDEVLKQLSQVSQQEKSKVSQINHRVVRRHMMDALNDKGHEVCETFTATLRRAMYHRASTEAQIQTSVRFEDLQLLDETQINTNIEASIAQQEISQAVEDVLPRLNALVSTLMGWMTVQPHLNPLRPESFARALHECLVAYVPSEEERQNLIAPAAGILGITLRGFYKDLSDWLMSMGVEPVMVLGSDAAGLASDGKLASNSVSRTLLTLDRLRRLLTGEFEDSRSPSGEGFLHTVPSPMVALEDLKMVEPLIRRLSEGTVRHSTALRGRDGAQPASVNANAKGSSSSRLSQQLGEAVAHLMVENLMQDQRLLQNVRDQIRILEPVILRLAQNDLRFFGDRKHPARQFLDRITHMSLRYQSERDQGFEVFYDVVTKAVRQLNQQAGDAQSFSAVLANLDASWAQSEKILRQRQEDAARALIHAEQRTLLAHRLAADFQDRLDGKRVPELIKGFLAGPWAHVVAQSQLAARGGVSDPHGYLALVDDLIWSVQVRLARRNRSRLVQMVPELLVKLRQGLISIDYPQDRMQRFFDAVIHQHEKAFEAIEEAKAKARAKADVQAKQSAQPPAQSQKNQTAKQGETRGFSSGANKTSAKVPQFANLGKVKSVVPTPRQWPQEDGLSGIEVRELGTVPADASLDSSSFSSGFGSAFDLDANGGTDAVWMGANEVNEAGYLPEGALLDAQDERLQLLSTPGDWHEADLAIGAWVEIQLKDRWVRAQMTWASPHRTLFMFISGAGLAHSMSRRTMDRLRKAGLMRVVATHRVMDNALDAVAQVALRNNRARR